MKVLLLSTDSQIFNKASQVRARILEYGKLFEELCVIVYTRPGEKEEKIGNISLVPTNNRFRIGYFSRAIRLGKAIMKDGAGWVVSSQDPFETGWVAYRLKKALRVSFQAQIHTDFLSPFFIKESLKHRLRVLLAKWLIKKADCIRVVSNRIKKSLVAFDSSMEKKITVLPIFVDKEVFWSASSEPRELHNIGAGDTLVLTVARRAPEKNIELANSIIGELRSRGNKVLWFHLGYGPVDKADINWLDTFIENPASMAPYYKMADLFLLTSNYEGYGMAAVEAAAAGIPVVMTDVGVALGATFPVGDKWKAVSIIEELIQNPEKRRKLVEKQNELFKNWPTKEQYLEQFRKSLTF
ncbi:MAG: glycosyltransferase family 4 protein [bacterium]|nr:glycosyltransferase family 4 protein [bacterium]